MGFREILIGFLLVGLFLIAMLNFGVQLADDNNAVTSLQDNSQINDTLNDLNTEFRDLEDTAKTQRENLETDTPILSFGELIFGTIVGAGFAFFSNIASVFNLILGLVFNFAFGGSPAFSIVIGAITVALLISIIFLLWRVIKSGD